MSRKSAVVLILLTAITVAAQAQTSNGSPLTRAQVRAEVIQARSQGLLPVGGEISAVPTAAASRSMLTRAQVLEQLRLDGPLPTAEGADVQLSDSVSLRSRAEVRAEAVAAVRNGTTVSGEL